MMRKFTRVLIIISLMLLLVAPLVAIFVISRAEIEKYETQPVPELIEKTYGEPCSVKRMDISEMITVAGTFVSEKKIFMDLPKLNDPQNTRMLVELGDEIIKEQIIGNSADLKTEIKATASGIVQNIVLGEISYVTLESTEDIALECRVDNTVLEMLRSEDVELTTQDGSNVTLLSSSRIEDENGESIVLLSVPDGVFGRKVNDLRLFTGRVFPKTLVIDARCLFHLNGDEETWYVRAVDADGYYIEDIEVTVGYVNEDYVSISGVEEGTLCDSGYRKIVEEQR